MSPFQSQFMPSRANSTQTQLSPDHLDFIDTPSSLECLLVAESQVLLLNSILARRASGTERRSCHYQGRAPSRPFIKSAETDCDVVLHILQ